MKNQILDEPEKENKGKKFDSLSDLRTFLFQVNKECKVKLNSGKSKTEIFSDFIAEHGIRYEKRISKIVGYSITDQVETENKTFIHILIALQVFIVIGQIILGYMYYSATENLLGLFVSTGLMLFVDLLILRKLKQKRLQILPVITIISVVRLLGIYTDFDDFQFGSWIYIYGFALITSLIISLWMKNKLFPNFGFFGPKKNQFGKYKF